MAASCLPVEACQASELPNATAIARESYTPTRTFAPDEFAGSCAGAEAAHSERQAAETMISIAFIGRISLRSCDGAQSSAARQRRSEEHTSELQSLRHLVCRLLLEKKK